MSKTEFLTTSDGVRIAYDLSGDGPAIMLLHGAGKTRKDWHKAGYVKRLRENFKVLTVDIRGSGDSEVLTRIEDYGIQSICSDLAQVADACGFDQMMVWGYSFGGNIARYLGAWSQRTTAIAVIGVPFGPAVHKEFDEYIESFMDKYGSLAKAYDEGTLNENKRKSAIKGRIPVWIACFQAMREWPDIDLESIKCPTLLLAGSKNRTAINWIDKERDALYKAGVQVEILEGLTHQQEFSQIDLVFPVVNKFMDEYYLKNCCK